MAGIQTSSGALVDALTEWDRRFREEPARFRSEAERLVKETPESYGAAAGPYLEAILAELPRRSTFTFRPPAELMEWRSDELSTAQAALDAGNVDDATRSIDAVRAIDRRIRELERRHLRGVLEIDVELSPEDTARLKAEWLERTIPPAPISELEDAPPADLVLVPRDLLVEVDSIASLVGRRLTSVPKEERDRLVEVSARVRRIYEGRS